METPSRHKTHRADANSSPANSSPGSEAAAVKIEKQGIRSLTLLFENKDTERKWHQVQMSRTRNITTRYLLFSALFQAVFYWSDVLESKRSDILQKKLFFSGMIRLALGLASLILCMLIGLRFVQPTQTTLYLVNITYSIPTLLLFCGNRQKASHWDSLYLSYGLAFFLLPKMSPLKFSYATAGSLILILVFIYTSAFRLDFQEWMLSNVLVLSIFLLMCYTSYSTERATRERWLLKERLEKEKISLRLVAGSIKDDLRRAAHEEQIQRNLRKLELMNVSKGLQDGVRHNLEIARNSFLAIRGGGLMSTPSLFGSAAPDDVPAQGVDANSNGTTDSKTKEDLKKNLALFLKGLMAWGTVVLLSYTFDIASRTGHSDIGDSVHHSIVPSTTGHATMSADTASGEVHTSMAFVLMMHTFGFSVFLLYFTGQIRWLIINGLVGLTLMWVFNLSGMNREWIVFGTHTVGYVILLIVVVVMVLVFGGVVMVWTNLVEFLKDILTRYPQVKGELSENKLLEQVIIGVIKELPEPEDVTDDGQSPCSISLEVTTGGGDLESPSKKRSDWSVSPSSASANLVGTLAAVDPLQEFDTMDAEAAKLAHNRKRSNSNGIQRKKGKTKLLSQQQRRQQQLQRPEDTSGSNSLVAFRNHTIVLPSGTTADTEFTSDHIIPCYFCSEHKSEALVPVCNAWQSEETSTSEYHCMDAQSLILAREKARSQERRAAAQCMTYVERCVSLEEQLSQAEFTLRQVRISHRELEHSSTAAKQRAEDIMEQALEGMRKQHASHLVQLQAEHTAQRDELCKEISQLKKLTESLLAQHRDTTVNVAGSLSAGKAANMTSQHPGSAAGGVVSPHIDAPISKSHSKDGSIVTSATNTATATLPVVLDKNGVDITLRSQRRNANNPNNPLYNPALKKTQTQVPLREIETLAAELSRKRANSYDEFLRRGPLDLYGTHDPLLGMHGAYQTTVDDSHEILSHSFMPSSWLHNAELVPSIAKEALLQPHAIKNSQSSQESQMAVNVNGADTPALELEIRSLLENVIMD